MNRNQRKENSREPADLYKDKVKSLMKNNEVLAKKLEMKSLELAKYKSLAIVLEEFKVYINRVKFKMTELRSVLESSIFKCDEIIPMLCLDAFEWPSSMTFSGGSEAPVVEVTKEKASEQDLDVDKNIPSSSNGVHNKGATLTFDGDLASAFKGASEKEASVKKNSNKLGLREVSKTSTFSQITLSKKTHKNSSEELMRNANMGTKLIKSDLYLESYPKSNKASTELSTGNEELNDATVDFGLGNSECRRQTFVVKTANITSKSNNRKTFIVKPTDINMEELSEESDSTSQQLLVVPEEKNIGVSESILMTDAPTTVIDSQKYVNDLEVGSNKDNACNNSNVNNSLNANVVYTDINNLKLRSAEKMTCTDGSHSSNKNGDDEVIGDANFIQEKAKSNFLCNSVKPKSDENTVSMKTGVHNSINDLVPEIERLLSEEDIEFEATPVRGQISSTKRKKFEFNTSEKKCKLEHKPHVSKIPRKVDAREGGMNFHKNATTVNIEEKGETEDLAPEEKCAIVSTQVDSDISNQLNKQGQDKPPEYSLAVLNKLPCASGVNKIDVSLTTLCKKQSRCVKSKLKTHKKMKELSALISISEKSAESSSPEKNNVISAKKKDGTENMVLGRENFNVVSTNLDFGISKPLKYPQGSKNELDCANSIDELKVPSSAGDIAAFCKPKPSRITKKLKKVHENKELCPLASLHTEGESSAIKNDVTSAEKEVRTENIVLAKENYNVVSTEVDYGISKLKSLKCPQAPKNEVDCADGSGELNVPSSAGNLSKPCKPKSSRITKKLKKVHENKELCPLASLHTEGESSAIKNDAKKKDGTEDTVLTRENHNAVSTEVDSGMSKPKPPKCLQAPNNELDCANGIDELNITSSVGDLPTISKPKPSRATKKMKKVHKIAKSSPAKNDIISTKKTAEAENLALAEKKIVPSEVGSVEVTTSKQSIQDQVQPLKHSQLSTDELNCANGIDKKYVTFSPSALSTPLKASRSQTTKKTKKSRKIKELSPAKNSKKGTALNHEDTLPSYSKNLKGAKVRQSWCKEIGSNKLVVRAEIHPVPPSPVFHGANKENEHRKYQPTVVLKDFLAPNNAELFNIDKAKDSARPPLSQISNWDSEENAKNVAAAEELTGRCRRARKEVNYKELPLSLKLRR